MPTDKQIDAATDAYLKARGWTEVQQATRAEVRERMAAALKAAFPPAKRAKPVKKQKRKAVR